MKRRILTTALLLMLTVLPAFARDAITPTELAPTEAERAALAETFTDYHLYEIDLEAVAAAARGDGELSLDLGHRQLELELETNDLRSPGFKRYATLADGETLVELDVPPVFTYKGQLVGQPDSVVRLSIRDDRFRGYVRGDGDWLWFDPLSDHLAGAAANRVVAYRASDVLVDAENAKCGFTDAQRPPAHFGLDADAIAAAPRNEAGLREWEVATEADGQWADRFGEIGGLDEIEDIINDVDGIYVSELSLTVNIAFQHIWTDLATDPFTSLDAGVTLDELVDYWNFPPPGIRRNHPRRDMVHLFSAKDFNGGIIGIAYVGVVCRNQNESDNLSFGISQDFGSDSQQIALVAHEMGHNWDANHLNSPPCNQTCDGNDQIMCSFIQSNPDLSFADCTKDQINDYVDAFGDLCLNP